jgi:hypothetical protein
MNCISLCCIELLDNHYYNRRSFENRQFSSSWQWNYVLFVIFTPVWGFYVGIDQESRSPESMSIPQLKLKWSDYCELLRLCHTNMTLFITLSITVYRFFSRTFTFSKRFKRTNLPHSFHLLIFSWTYCMYIECTFSILLNRRKILISNEMSSRMLPWVYICMD